jgi:hypothetical protein
MVVPVNVSTRIWGRVVREQKLQSSLLWHRRKEISGEKEARQAVMARLARGTLRPMVGQQTVPVALPLV